MQRFLSSTAKVLPYSELAAHGLAGHLAHGINRKSPLQKIAAFQMHLQKHGLGPRRLPKMPASLYNEIVLAYLEAGRRPLGFQLVRMLEEQLPECINAVSIETVMRELLLPHLPESAGEDHRAPPAKQATQAILELWEVHKRLHAGPQFPAMAWLYRMSAYTFVFHSYYPAAMDRMGRDGGPFQSAAFKAHLRARSALVRLWDEFAAALDAAVENELKRAFIKSQTFSAVMLRCISEGLWHVVYYLLDYHRSLRPGAGCYVQLVQPEGNVLQWLRMGRLLCNEGVRFTRDFQYDLLELGGAADAVLTAASPFVSVPAIRYLFSVCHGGGSSRAAPPLDVAAYERYLYFCARMGAPWTRSIAATCMQALTQLYSAMGRGLPAHYADAWEECQRRTLPADMEVYRRDFVASHYEVEMDAVRE